MRNVLVGNARGIVIPRLEGSASQGRLRGLRLLHTHLDDGPISQEDLMDMLFLRLDAVIALTVDENGLPLFWQSAHLLPTSATEAEPPYRIEEPRPWHRTEANFSETALALEDEFGRAEDMSQKNPGAGRAMLISVSEEPRTTQERNLVELAELASTAGLTVAGTMAQRVPSRNPRSILSRNKLSELEVLALQANADVLVFDGELSPSQLHNLADLTERKVLDRTQLILDIFAQHATSAAGKLQVEIAQLRYTLPRLAGRNRAMDRLMGGIGGRGPGESRLETDRRKSRERMAHLHAELNRLRRQRAFVRGRRKRQGIPVAALVGYTNAGKSTLLNTLTKSGVLTANRLFATLDPTTRRLRFPAEREIILSDTVGFIRNLPKELLEAFRATLEELDEASLLVHVADATHPDLLQQMAAVEGTLEELGLGQRPRILALNKWDALEPSARQMLLASCPGAIPVSALSGEGCGDLMRRLERELLMGQTGPQGPLTLQ